MADWAVPVLAGGGAGLIETVVTYPLDLAKTRQQASKQRETTATGAIVCAILHQ